MTCSASTACLGASRQQQCWRPTTAPNEPRALTEVSALPGRWGVCFQDERQVYGARSRARPAVPESSPSGAHRGGAPGHRSDRAAFRAKPHIPTVPEGQDTQKQRWRRKSTHVPSSVLYATRERRGFRVPDPNRLTYSSLPTSLPQKAVVRFGRAHPKLNTAPSRGLDGGQSWGAGRKGGFPRAFFSRTIKICSKLARTVCNLFNNQ